MDNISKIAVLIVAAGKGERFGADAPKQYMPLLGKSVLRWSIDAFRNHPAINNVFVAIDAAHLPFYNQAISGLDLPVPLIGGATRQETVRKALETIAQTAKPDFILIHDGARPLLSQALMTRTIDALQSGNSAVIPALPVVDTLKRVSAENTETVSRESLYAVQTPQAFAFDAILSLHKAHADKSVTDDAGLYEAAGHKIHLIAGERENIKITMAEDLALAEQSLAMRLGDIRTGQGYDVHRLVPPRDAAHKLMIGGVHIPHDKALEGHSDADVALHAITDALLATIGDGDIGMHFSPKDARWKNADSTQFLKHANQLLQAQGGAVAHVDVTIICEEPKIGPHREKIRARIADMLDLPVHRVSVKATTTEGLGFTGRREGIAAQSIVTARLPFATLAASASTQSKAAA